jgi:phosphohistidine swiveling domain-containing protein
MKRQQEKHKKLIEKFLEEVEDQILMPPQHNSSIIIQASGWNASKYFSPYFSNKLKLPVLVLSNKEEGVMHYPFSKLMEMGKEFFIKNWKDRSLLKERIDLFEKFSKITNKIYSKFDYKFINKKDLKDLLPEIKESYEATIKLNASSAFSFYFDRKMYDSLIQELNIKINEKNLDLVWELGIDPPINSFEKTRQIDALTIISKKEDVSKIAEKLQYFGATYGHIKSLEDFEREFKEEYKEYIKNPKRAIKAVSQNKLETDKKIKEFYNKTKNLNQDEKKLIQYMNKIIELRDKRKDIIAKMTLVYFRALECLFTKYNLPKELIYFYRFDELLKGEEYFKIKIKELPKRKDGYCCLAHYNGEIEESYDFNKNKEIMKDYYMSKVKKSDKIKGQPAYPGKIHGKVKIIMNKKSFSNLKKGDILVTGMTRPEFIPLMKLASAIITDEGGVTCHAAIVAREMKKPCIIGTKNATQVLKDGMEVEVDANKGIVRILKRKV